MRASPFILMIQIIGQVALNRLSQIVKWLLLFPVHNYPENKAEC